MPSENDFKVDFFLAGFPKCGTTSIADYLCKHPNICFSIYKEPGYFLPQNWSGSQRYILSLKNYKKQFTQNSQTKLSGEGSTFYIYSREAIENIANHNPSAKLIFVVRNPIEQIQSLHSHRKRNPRMKVSSLETEWNTQEEQGIEFHIFPSYKEGALQGKYLAQVFDIFPKEQILILILDDLKKSPQKTYDQILNFLELLPHTLPTHKKQNERREFKNGWSGQAGRILIKAVQNPALNRVMIRTKQLLGVRDFKIRSTIERVTMNKEKQTPLSPEFHKQMKEAFQEDVQLLGKLTSRDLSGWLKKDC